MMSIKMLEQSIKKHPEISFSIGSAEDLNEIRVNTFDIVTASYVVHGVKLKKRVKMISEMKKVSKQHVVIHS